METKSFAVAEVKSVDGENPNGEFEVVLSTGTKDRDGEVLVPGAFEPLPKSIPIHVLHQFSSQLPVGRAEPFYDGDVLKGKGYYASTPEAQTVRTLVREKIVDSVSVGFMRQETDRKDGIPHVTKGTLLEASFVGVPANPEAAVLLAKGLDAKVGARNSRSDQANIQAAHDAIIEAGASCMPMDGKAAGHSHPHAHMNEKALTESGGGGAAVQPDYIHTHFHVHGDGNYGHTGDSHPHNHAHGKAVMAADTDEDPGALAQAVDAALDSLAECLSSGDVEQATALLTSAEATVDTLLEVLGVPDADDPATPDAAAPKAAAEAQVDTQDFDAHRRAFALSLRSVT